MQASDGRLEACLENANTRGAFRVHLKKQMCDENLFFYEDLLLYRQNTNAAKRKIMYDTYIIFTQFDINLTMQGFRNLF